MIFEPKIKGYVESQLRRIFRWSLPYKKCKSRTRIQGEIYRCEGCEALINKRGKDTSGYISSEAVYSESLHVDHIDPVCPVTGWKDDTHWSSSIVSRICVTSESELQYLCSCCHYIKTQIENDERRENKKNAD